MRVIISIIKVRRRRNYMYDPYFSYASESLLYIAVLIVAVIGMIASLKGQSTFNK